MQNFTKVADLVLKNGNFLKLRPSHREDLNSFLLGLEILGPVGSPYVQGIQQPLEDHPRIQIPDDFVLPDVYDWYDDTRKAFEETDVEVFDLREDMREEVTDQYFEEKEFSAKFELGTMDQSTIGLEDEQYWAIIARINLDGYGFIPGYDLLFRSNADFAHRTQMLLIFRSHDVFDFTGQEYLVSKVISDIEISWRKSLSET